MKMIKIVFSVLIVGLTVVANLAMFDVVSPKIFFGYLFTSISVLLVSIIWS